ncbi:MULTISPECIES: MSMEG_0565 family glycosyltransferase [Pseudonocardia]|uniref:GDP-mannose-dependent alpha-(1-2)-phosphatidylinositol mannosyltransferase n=2 Tax=Pseudonocardia TaxID=1847 RepID=A0A1Y2N9A3_PSEAH|nr:MULTISPECIES: MSMEG_0565 family glycosyltransferase [Pseudonocardia]OSY43488.1 GDP-mannose-dependent alpha-(1-2)-phosphatidylinositol mannosyltransferase [Pseudonocardia autotrophica]TDN73518.1 glycosyltransferase-like protein [Pseudonocardia autotrophica]BBG04262.1 glycosyl transferase family 1 [Pseudonocardia autotrophica]GEC25595.1 glycosyl transferase family 1 [Pseudonocardia saturnea]
MTGLALVTHSTSPRGGMVHTLALAEALQAAGTPVHLVTQGDPAAGLHRHTTVPFTVLPAPDRSGTLTDRVYASIDALTAALHDLSGAFDVLHAQDCIAARAAARVRDAGARVSVVRTVHHVDDFTTPALVACQQAAIVEPDRVLVVSRQWERILRDEYGVPATVVPNGVDAGRFGPVADGYREQLRRSIGAGDRFVLLGVGGIEPRKGTRHAFEALSRLYRSGTRPVLAIVGGHSFQDYAAYREEALAALPGLGLELGRDVVLLGTVDDRTLSGWYRSADALLFPSVKEGWGLAVLEAMAADLPVIASDLPVFREYLVDGRNALLPAVGDASAIADAVAAVVADPELRERLRDGGRRTVPGYTWQRSAAAHRAVYDRLRAGEPVS